MFKYKKGAFVQKRLAGIHVAKSFKAVIIHLFPDLFKYFFTVIRKCSLFPSFCDKIRTYVVNDKSVRQSKTTSFNKSKVKYSIP